MAHVPTRERVVRIVIDDVVNGRDLPQATLGLLDPYSTDDILEVTNNWVDHKLDEHLSANPPKSTTLLWKLDTATNNFQNDAVRKALRLAKVEEERRPGAFALVQRLLGGFLVGGHDIHDDPCLRSRSSRRTTTSG